MGSFAFKTFSAIFAIPFIFAYYLAFQFAHLYYFGTPYPLNWLVYTYLIAIFIHMSYFTDEKAEVKLCGKRTGIVVEHGWFPLANFFHFTVSLFNGFAILFGIVVPSEKRAQELGRSDIEVYINQLINRYVVNMNVGPLTGAFMRLIDNIIVWTFRKPHLIPMRFGFLLMAILFSASMVHNGTLYLGAKTTETVNSWAGKPTSVRAVASAIPLVPDLNSFSSSISGWWKRLGRDARANPPMHAVEDAEPSTSKALVTVQLSVGRDPVMLEAGWFVPDSEENTLYYKVVEGEDRKYYLYPKIPPNLILHFTVKESCCVLVPPGKQIFFSSKSAPTNAVNMKDSVLFVKKEEYLTMRDKLIRWKEKWPTDKKFVATLPWETLHERWHEVNTDNNQILVEAQPSKALKRNSWGGIVCF